MDGTDINDVSNSTPGGAAGFTLGVETIREFQILTNAYSAEFGRNAGGVINVVTRAGTNELHGSLYEFIRNDALDAKNFFDDPSQDVPPFKRNQFGVMVAGPVRKDKTFFMANYEGLRERLGLSNVARVPTAEARQGRLPGRTVTVAERVKPYLALFPLPNGRDFGNGTAEFFSSPTQPTDEDLLVGRIDHKLSENDLLFGRYTLDDSDRVAPDENLLFFNNFVVRNQYVTLEEQHAFSSRVLNIVRFGFSRSANSTFPSEIRKIDPALSFIPGHLLGRISIVNLGAIGTPTLGPRTFVYNVFDVQDHVNWTIGRHSIKFGANGKRFQDNQVSNFQFNGSYSFLSLADFLQGNAQSIEIQLPSSVCQKLTGQPCDGIRYQRQSLFGFYLQDDFKATTRLTLNLGLRYEFITVPREIRGKESNLRNVLDPEVTLGPPFRNPSLRNFAPRLGLAWDPFGDGKTSVRLGLGAFYDQVLGYAMLLPATRQPPFFLQANLRNPPFPNIMDRIGEAIPQLRLNQIDFDLDTPIRTQYNLSIQREIVSGLVFNVGYIGSQSRHQIVLIDEANTAWGVRLADGRKFFPPGLPRRNPNFENIGRRHSDGNGFYNSLQLGINKRFSGGTLFQFSYTLSKNVTDGDLVVAGTSDNNSTSVVDPDNRKHDRGLAQFDIHHNAVANYVIELPFGPGKRWGANVRGLAGALIGGWELSGIASFASGHPFTVTLGFDRARQHVRSGGGGQRPDLKPGCDKNPVLGGPDQYFDPNCFLLPAAGFYGTLGRNTLIGPSLTNFDFSLVKRFPLGEERSLQFRAEFFNLFNHPNFDVPSARTIFLSGGVRAAGAGRITSTVTTSRQIQFGLKLIF